MDMFRRLFGQTGDEPEESQLAKSDSSQPASTGAAAQDDNNTLPVAPDESMATDESSPTSLPMDLADGATRQLPLETVIASRNAHIHFGQSTDVGMVRTNNQDAMMSLYFSSRSVDNRPDFGLFIVADGMGGHHDGEKAAAIVTRTVTRHVINNIFLPMLSDVDENMERPPLTESLVEAIQTANSNVINEVPDGGTTVTAVAVVGDLAYFAHVGDSRAYLIMKGQIEQVTRDHSLVQRLIELDQLTQEEAQDHPQQNVLYRAIGQSDSLEVDALTRRLPAKSHLLICSDGLWGLVDEQKILQIVLENPEPQVACDKLVATANSMGGRDNITAVLLHMPG